MKLEATAQKIKTDEGIEYLPIKDRVLKLGIQAEGRAQEELLAALFTYLQDSGNWGAFWDSMREMETAGIAIDSEPIKVQVAVEERVQLPFQFEFESRTPDLEMEVS